MLGCNNASVCVSKPTVLSIDMYYVYTWITNPCAMDKEKLVSLCA